MPVQSMPFLVAVLMRVRLAMNFIAGYNGDDIKVLTSWDRPSFEPAHEGFSNWGEEDEDEEEVETLLLSTLSFCLPLVNPDLILGFIIAIRLEIENRIIMYEYQFIICVR